jgi:ABC-2 type transport system ATP-binding protein
MTNVPLITATGISRYYGQRLAIENISFTIHRGEIVCFLGPNGAGKSTLMQIICGVMAASSGAVTIAGFDIIEQPLQAKQHLGYLPEQPPVYPDCTVDEYLAYCGRLRGIPSNRLVTCIDTSKQKCGLTAVGKRLIGNLSKGYQQRIGIAQALIHEPAVIILDEPSSGVDPNQMIEIRELIREMGKHHSIILSTHMLAEAETTCDRVLILHAGTVVLDSVMAKLTQPLEQTYLQLTGTAHSNAKAQTA